MSKRGGDVAATGTAAPTQSTAGARDATATTTQTIPERGPDAADGADGADGVDGAARDWATWASGGWAGSRAT
jgi:hypothetical protein